MHGEGWPDLTVASRQVPNAELGRLYASAGVVLNDHWADMRRDGFVSNRLFDAAACGARVLSDDVAGASELFGGLVLDLHRHRRGRRAPGRGADRLAGVQRTGPAGRAGRPRDSFDRRAETLVDALAQRLLR